MDNLIPANGEAFVMPTVPENRQHEEQQETNKLQQSYPVLQEVVDWFKEAIAAADSLQNISLEAITRNGVVHDRKTSVEGQVLAHQLLQQLLIDKSSEWVEFLQKIEDKREGRS